MDSEYSPSKLLPEPLPGFPPFPSFNLEQLAVLPPWIEQHYFPSQLTSDFNFKPPKPEPIESNQWISQLPDLRSLEKHPHLQEEEDRVSNTYFNLPMIPASTKRIPPASFSTDSLFVRNHLPSPSPSVKPIKANELARKRRKTITEKTRSLAKLMPWEKKMNTATMLEEAHKYIKFLQAQVSVLQSMPYQSLIPPVSGGGGSSFGGLEKLNRQQLLQVLLNSPVAQSVLSAQGSCVYSLEQVVLLKKNLLEQMVLLGSSVGHP